MENDRMTDINKIEERILSECDKFKLPEQTLTAAMRDAYRMADKLKSSKVSQVKGSSLSKIKAIADRINDAVADAKCKVDCITITGEKDADAESFAHFAEDCEDRLACINSMKFEASRKLTQLAMKAESTKNLDMGKVHANVFRIISGLQYNFKRVMSSSVNPVAFDKTVVQKNLQNLSNKAKGGQKLNVLVDWSAAGIDKNRRLFELTLDELQSLIVHMRGGRE